ncbi:MAG: aldehyde dehydrogenase family protein [Acidimicrobiia bacterium]|nr:aldehyde dehydrogenase family protein [Acidimicrobiia bacterium]
MAETFGNFVAGEWVKASSGKTFDSINPANTDDLVACYQASSVEDAKNTIDVAQKAQAAWAAIPAPNRGVILMRAAELLEKRSESVAADMTREEGKTLPEAKGEVGRAVNILRYFGGEGARLGGETVPSEREGVFAYTFRKPLGVVSLLTPWNFPIAIPAWKMAPALIAGNTVVIKPASAAPLCTVRLIEVLHESGLPKGVLNMVTGSGSVIGDELISNPAVKAVSFTGSCEVGNGIQNKTVPRGTKTQLEMGGKNPTIVLRDADLNMAADIVVNGAFFSTGQKCTATSRALIEEPIFEEFVRLLVEKTRRLRVGNGIEKGVDIGPCVDEGQMKTVLRYVDIGKKEGAKLLCGGHRLSGPGYDKGYFVEPTIFSDVTPDMTIAQEEIFGPVLAVIPVKDIDAAIAVANNVKFGLSASLLTNQLNKVFRYINRIEAGLIIVNLPSAGVEYQLPFGGTKASSTGFREQGSVAIDFYSELRTVYLKHQT